MRWRRLTRSDGVATLGVLVAAGLLASSVMFGSGYRDATSSVSDGITWLFSKDGNDNRLTLANGGSGQAEKRTYFEGANGEVELIQRDGVTLIRTGDTVRRLDDDLTVAPAGTAVHAANQLVIGDGVVYVVSGGDGKVWASDPDSLKRVGDVVQMPKALSSAVYGADEHLWVASPKTGEVIGATGTKGAGAALDHRVKVGKPGGTEVLLQDGMPVAVSPVDHKIVTIRDGKADRVLQLPAGMSTKGLVVPEAVEGSLVPVLDKRKAVIFASTPAGPLKIKLSADHDYGAPVGYARKFFVPNFTEGTLQVFGPDGDEGRSIPVPDAGKGAFELRIDGGFLWANDFDSRNALVIGPDGRLRTVDKYDKKAPGPAPKKKNDPGKDSSPLPPPDSAPGANPSPNPSGSTPGTTTTVPQVAPPAATKPEPPTNPDALPGNKSATVSWQPPGNDGGSPILGYRVSWTPSDPGDSKASNGQVELTRPDLTKEVGDLHNGSTYEFTIEAHNAVGWSEPSRAVSAKPSNKIPLPPTGVEASQTTDNKDGSIDVSWIPGEDQGYRVDSFQIIATPSAGGAEQVVADATSADCGGSSCSTRVPVQPSNWLGVEQRFTVVADATSGGGAASEPSDPSSGVTPATPPDPPTLGSATESADGRTITIPVAAGFDGGHPVTAAAVTVDGGSPSNAACSSAGGVDVSCTVTANVPDRSGSHTVDVSLTNDMGTTASTGAVTVGAKAPPTGSISGSSPDYNVGRVSWSAGGDGITCSVTGPNLSNSNCQGSVDISLGAGNYTYTLTVTSPYFAQFTTQSNTFSVADRPPPATVSVSKGGAKTISGCSTASCRWVTVSVANMSGPYNVQCWSTKDASAPFYTYTTNNPTSNVCVFGYTGAQVWAVVNGVTSPRINW